MINTADLLRLSQWLSPAFPVSGYAYSHGLETAMAEGRVTDADSTAAWVRTVLGFGTGRLDCWAIRSVLAGADPDEVSTELEARAGSAERWAETRDMGAAFTEASTAAGQPAMKAYPLPVALAVRATGMAPEPVCALYLQSFAGQLVSAATRFLPLGQGEAQAVLSSLHPLLADLAGTEYQTPPGSAAFAAELDAMRHAFLEPRIFRT